MPLDEKEFHGLEQIAPLAVLRSPAQPSATPAYPEPVSLERPAALDAYVVARGPKKLTLESSSVCNLRCVMCPQGRGLVQRPKHLEAALLEKIHPALHAVEWVQLHGIGEPLSSPAFWRALEVFDSMPTAYITVNSNMTVITDEQIGKILNSRLGEISVSLDAATPETYAKIRGYDLNRVIDNIKRLIARRNAAGRKKPEIFLNMTLMRENIEELEAFVELGHRMGVEGICFWQLNRGEDYSITKDDGWIFDYQKQMLRNHARLSNDKIRAAFALGKRLGIPIKADPAKDLYFAEAV
jgi:MoaA/NifB/PqqE/SkfB family radical SAM enzyme